MLVGWDTLDGSDVPARGVRPVPERSRVRRRAARAARRCSPSWCVRLASPQPRRRDTRRTTSWPRPSWRRSRWRARCSSSPPTGTRSSWPRSRVTLLMPTRGVSELARVGPDGGARALRRRARAGARLHRAAGRPVGQAARRAGRRAEGRRADPARVRLARGGARRPGASRRSQRNYACIKRIATLDASAPLPPLEDQSPLWAEASSLLSSWGMNQMAERLAARAGVTIRGPDATRTWFSSTRPDTIRTRPGGSRCCSTRSRTGARRQPASPTDSRAVPHTGVRRAHPIRARADLARRRHDRVRNDLRRCAPCGGSRRSRQPSKAASRSSGPRATMLWPTRRWASASSTTSRSPPGHAQARARHRADRDRRLGRPSRERHRRRSSGTTRPSSSSRCTSGRSTPAQAGRTTRRETTLNVPLAAGSGDEEYERAFEHVVEPAVRAFEPELVLVSAGFDATSGRSAREHERHRGRLPRARPPQRRPGAEVRGGARGRLQPEHASAPGRGRPRRFLLEVRKTGP